MTIKPPRHSLGIRPGAWCDSPAFSQIRVVVYDIQDSLPGWHNCWPVRSRRLRLFLRRTIFGWLQATKQSVHPVSSFQKQHHRHRFWGFTGG